MPHKSNRGVSKNSGKTCGDVSFHFKDLCVTDEAPDIVFADVGTGSHKEGDYSTSYSQHTGDCKAGNTGSGGDRVGKLDDVSETVHQAVEAVQSTSGTTQCNTAQSCFPRQEPTRTGSPRKEIDMISGCGGFHSETEGIVIKSDQDWNTEKKIEAHGKEKVIPVSINPTSTLNLLHVEDHPLATHTSTGNSSSDDDVSNADEGDLSNMHRPNIPSTSVCSENHGMEGSERAITKDMISNALFDSKARTQLLTTLKKNIQHYTNSAGKTGEAHNVELLSVDHDTPLRNVLDTSSSHLRNQLPTKFKNDILQVANEDPLKVVKPVSENCTEDDPQSEGTSLKKQSSPENKFTDLQSTMSLRGSRAIRKRAHSARLTPVSVSLSALLADRQDSQIDNPPELDDDINKDHSERLDVMPLCEVPEVSDAEPLDGKRGMIENKKISLTCQLPSKYTLYVMSVLTYLYITLPLPFAIHTALTSFIVGVMCSATALCFLTSSKKQRLVVTPPYVSQRVPHQLPEWVFNPKQAFKGWMNEIEMYDIDTYHINSTRSVFVTLDGSTLRLQTPRRNIPRRAAFGEANIQVSNVIQQRLYDLSKATVYLVPTDLIKKRLWSKKYPICVEFTRSFCDKEGQSCHESVGVDEHCDPDDTYDVITEDVERIYLFGRTQRQKEEWFYRFQRAINLTRKKTVKRSGSPQQCDSNTETKPQLLDDEGAESLDPIKMYEEYYVYICQLLPDPGVYQTSRSNSSQMRPESGTIYFSALANKSDESPEVVTSQPSSIPSVIGNHSKTGLDVAWFNVVIGRIMFDFLRLRKWAEWMSNKIQKKLEKIKLPYFMEGLKLTDIDLGKSVPLVQQISLPRLDSQGVWIDMDISYSGSVQLTLETKMVLTRLGKRKTPSAEKSRLERSTITNSEEEDSAESSDGEESTFANRISETAPKGASSPRELSGPHTATQGKRWVRIMDSITKSKYFQKVTETTYVKKKLETVSNTPLILTAELNQCQGTICINIPPPPSDRIWYGFKDHPFMLISARPQLGERAVTVTPITDWIEKKLIQEFNKVLLMPNMDDIPVPLMFNNLPTRP